MNWLDKLKGKIRQPDGRGAHDGEMQRQANKAGDTVVRARVEPALIPCPSPGVPTTSARRSSGDYIHTFAKSPDPEGIEPDPLAMKELIGQRIEVRRLLGEGAFGVVQAAYDRVTGKFCAIKRLHPELCRDVEFRKLFEREATIWTLLPPHEHIVKLFGLFPNAGLLFILMEWIVADSARRVTLSDFINDCSDDLRPVYGLPWARQVAEAMSHAHASGITAHRDLKPGNILITKDRCAKVTDFGLAFAGSSVPLLGQFFPAAIRSSASERFSILQAAGEGICGTPGYIAPEILCGQPPSQQSDIYSFGVVLWNIISGEHDFPGDLPYLGESDLAIRLNANKRSLCQRMSTASLKQLAETVARCIAPDPDCRFNAFSEIVQSLPGISTYKEEASV